MGKKLQARSAAAPVAAATAPAADAVEVGEKEVAIRDVLPKIRCLVLSSRGITDKHRHLLNDLVAIIPHCKKDSKLDSKSQLTVLNEVCELKGCGSCIFFEARKKRDLYMWMARCPEGPSVKFMVTAIHTMDELKLTGNCLKGSRAILHFDGAFDDEMQPQLGIMKEVLEQVFAVPVSHSKTKPFVDHVISFHYLDGRIWFRHFQIVDVAATQENKHGLELVEIGPRFVLQPIRVFDSSFHGRTLYENPDFVSPNVIRRNVAREDSVLHAMRKKQQNSRRKREEKLKQELDEFDTLFEDENEDI
eukprot:ANDGO_05126.mRNA.1 Ribosome biogenesis protein BRX1 homolog